MTTWIKRWDAEIAPTKVPGVWRMKTGGCLVRARASDPTGKLVEIRKRLPEADEARAFVWLEDERARIRGEGRTTSAKTRFAEFAASLLEEKVASGDIASARGREKWRFTLEHLINGTKGVPGFGPTPIDRITIARAESWRAEIGKLIGAGAYSPATANGWLSIFKVIMRAARRRMQLPIDPSEDLRYFDTSSHATYTEEEPNALTAQEAKLFLAAMKSEFPQHYAMTFLGFATGLRPSHLRPLRRSGKTPDVLWDEAVLLVRRSHTLRHTMERTKTKLRQRLHLPPELLTVLKWHVDTQLVTAEQRESSLLFPAEDGRERSESALKKPFAIVAALIGLKKKITPRGMRRTFNDLTRAARVEGVVTRSISGHSTKRMQEHYSTVSPDEQRAAMRGLLRLVRGGDERGDDKKKRPAARAKRA